jgi:plasmid stabilization system protein ParE
VKYRVRLTAKAEQDIDSVLQWFAKQLAHAAGARWLEQLLLRIATLETQPQRCPMATEAAELGLEIRELIFGRRRGRYRLFFQIIGNMVFILRVWHGARDEPTLEDL